MGDTTALAIGVAVVLVLLAAQYAYRRGDLNKYLPASLQKAGFVGAYAAYADRLPGVAPWITDNTMTVFRGPGGVIFNAGTAV